MKSYPSVKRNKSSYFDEMSRMMRRLKLVVAEGWKGRLS